MVLIFICVFDFVEIRLRKLVDERESLLEQVSCITSHAYSTGSYYGHLANHWYACVLACVCVCVGKEAESSRGTKAEEWHK